MKKIITIMSLITVSFLNLSGCGLIKNNSVSSKQLKGTNQDVDNVQKEAVVQGPLNKEETEVAGNIGMQRPLNKKESMEEIGDGIGPIKESIVYSEEINEKMANDGFNYFSQKCSACHKYYDRYVGPALRDVTLRRTGAWIMNMIMNPVEMTQKDATAKKLLADHLTQMTYQNVTLEEARCILEYLRAEDHLSNLDPWTEGDY